MQTDHKSDGGRGASLSRRKFFQIAAAGTAAAMPAVAEAATGEIPQLPLTDEQQLDASIGQLKNILARMHPGFSIVHGDRLMHGDGGSSVIVSVQKPTRNLFDGDGFYEVEAHGRYYPAGIYKVTRVWSDEDKTFWLWGSLYWDGHLISPREIIAPHSIVRKLEGGAE
ncbi:hypothetical protein GFL95_14340 [Rhizobium leguminosarum bv. viciae]|uniref:hypothetical protein n=1 Tax=Rhizobium leguminosarum TaxID=384 RepID=UPI001441FAC1|nr:hypothetical protein [Rhizobium leguminosarum]NKK92394.1 hypothetical protein [Rhizobium leguminosarum bv. viciae]